MTKCSHVSILTSNGSDRVKKGENSKGYWQRGMGGWGRQGVWNGMTESIKETESRFAWSVRRGQTATRCRKQGGIKRIIKEYPLVSVSDL